MGTAIAHAFLDAGYRTTVWNRTAAKAGDAASTIHLNRPAVDALIAVSGERGVDPALHRPLKELLDRRSADGHGDDSFAAVYELLRLR
ncbi:hypothetical protein ACFOY2_22065 [Nonomuraea purpurea]|uniref:NADPH-dependent reductive aminase-like C-terminal domain-containing protein n=1 Tax=Nonomuraea purpurea TaxID=1849276 RepID=A0ABV8G7G4_9ACTN